MAGLKPRMGSQSLVFIGVVLGSMVGCAPNGRDLTADEYLIGSGPYTYADHDWAQVLNEYVKDGLVDYRALNLDPQPLRRYCALLGVTGPARTPGQFGARADVVAYWINAYNACVLWVVIDHYPIRTVYDLSLPRLCHEYRFMVDGQMRSLADIETRLLASSSGDVRTLLATSRAAMGTPPLLKEPIRAGTLDQQLARIAVTALDNPRLLQVDHARQSVWVWQHILQRERDFVSYWQKRRRTSSASLMTVLMGLASPEKQNELKMAAGYTVRQIPFDRNLNDWSQQRRPVP